MTLLELEHVCKRGHTTLPDPAVLRDVCLQVDRGEVVAVWGTRRSGRSTLLRLAAGIEAPDSGVVRFSGHDLARGRGRTLGGELGYCFKPAAEAHSRLVLEELTYAQLARGTPQAAAHARAAAALARSGASDCAERRGAQLDTAEQTRVAIAKALVLEPRLLLIDEPTAGVDLLERDPILSLLRSLADEGLAILMTAGDATALAGADRALSLSEGTLRGALIPELAEVLPLRRASG